MAGPGCMRTSNNISDALTEGKYKIKMASGRIRTAKPITEVLGHKDYHFNEDYLYTYLGRDKEPVLIYRRDSGYKEVRKETKEYARFFRVVKVAKLNGSLVGATKELRMANSEVFYIVEKSGNTILCTHSRGEFKPVGFNYSIDYLERGEGYLKLSINNIDSLFIDRTIEFIKGDYLTGCTEIYTQVAKKIELNDLKLVPGRAYISPKSYTEIYVYYGIVSVECVDREGNIVRARNHAFYRLDDYGNWRYGNKLDCLCGGINVTVDLNYMKDSYITSICNAAVSGDIPNIYTSIPNVSVIPPKEKIMSFPEHPRKYKIKFEQL